MFNFTEEQRFAALTLEKPIVVTAAAGSGKTTVLVARYLELLKTGLKPNEILTVTFTTDAADQLRARITQALSTDPNLASLIPEVSRSRFIGTIHSFCYYLLQEFGSVLGYPPIEEILSQYRFQTELEDSYKAWLHSLSADELRRVLSIVQRTELRDLFCDFYESRRLINENVETLPMEPHLTFIFNSMKPFLFQLQNSLYEKGLFRFDDLEHLSLDLLNQHLGVKTRLQNQFKTFLIDEFQDTSQIQWAIFKQLLGKAAEKLFVVGDPKQSIYSFRHADVSLFFEVSELTQQWGGDIAELNTNFRTQSTLIEDINSFSRQFFENSLIPFQPMRSGRDIVGEKIRVQRYGGALHGNTPPPEKADKKEEELTAVLDAIDEYHQQGNPLSDLTLLFRMGDRIETYANALKARNIAVHCTQTLSLFSHYDILDLCHYLKALNQPKDSYSLSAFLYSPWVGLKLEDLAHLRDEDSPLAFEERVKNKLRPQLEWFFRLALRPQISLRTALYELFGNSSYFPAAAEPFLEMLKPLTEKNYSLSEAIEDLELWKKNGIHFHAKSGSAEQDGVKLMTVHASKGLEFEHVFLVDCLRRSPSRLPTLLTHPKEAPSMKYREGKEAIFPEQYLRLKDLKEQLDSEESRRILYVAMTRAKSTLTLFLPKEMKGVPHGSWAHLLSGANRT